MLWFNGLCRKLITCRIARANQYHGGPTYLISQLHAEGKEGGVAPACCCRAWKRELLFLVIGWNTQQPVVRQFILRVKGTHQAVQAALTSGAARLVTQLGALATYDSSSSGTRGVDVT